MNTAAVDQLEAAVAEATRAVARAGAMIGGHTFDDPTLAQAIIDRLAPTGVPEAFCFHAARGPRPLFLSPAVPGAALCGRCVWSPEHLAAMIAHAKTTDCDACGRDSERFYEAVVTSGPFVLFANVCPACRDGAV